MSAESARFTHAARFTRAARFLRAACLAVALLAVVPPSVAHAQIGKLKKAVQRAAENETERQVERKVREAVRCAFDDPACIEEAERSGESVVLVDAGGRVITDSDGRPVTDRGQAEAIATAGAGGGGEAAPVRPGQGVWANYDFVRGERILFADDFSRDRVGDFPRSLEFVSGNVEVIEWEGGRALRASADSRLEVQLPEILPERFTIEFDYHQRAGHLVSSVATAADRLDPGSSFTMNRYPGSVFRFGNRSGVAGAGRESLTGTKRTREKMTAIRIHVDGAYAKVYTDEERIANVPNAEILRGDRIAIHLHGRKDQPAYLANLVIAAGGGDLYDALSRDGRVATQGILFDTNSDVIQPESTPTLREIGEMLEAHADLGLRIEGHTDAQGDDAFNQDLSERRAGAVVAWLTAEFGIDAARLESVGLGESSPVADNATPEGRQQNRRVELVVR